MAWSDLTKRQQELDRAIESSNIKLDSSSSCLRKVMKAIGARDSEITYVQSRIALRLKAQTLLDETDDFITRTERMRDKFKNDCEKREQEDRKLGFKF